MMRTPLMLFAVLVFLCSPVHSATEPKDLKKYGNCGVGTFVDMFTDEKTYTVGCGDTSGTRIDINSRKGQLIVFLTPGRPIYPVDSSLPVVDVDIRIDKGEVISLSHADVVPGGSVAIIKDRDLALRLLRDLARGQRLTIAVGDDSHKPRIGCFDDDRYNSRKGQLSVFLSGSTRLDGTAAAIEDFRRRAGLGDRGNETYI